MSVAFRSALDARPSAPVDPPPALKSIDLLSVRIDALDKAALLKELEAAVGRRDCLQVVTANALMILAAEKNEDLRSVFQGARFVVPDSQGVLLAARLKGEAFPQKLPGVELIEDLCRLAAEKAWRVFFLGAGPGVARQTAERLAGRHPGLIVAGHAHGHFSPEEEAVLVQNISSARPDLLFVALNLPRQEIWISRHLRALGARVAMGVGGSFDVISGRLKRAPLWMQRAGLEWFFRLLQEPRRFARMTNLPVFFWKVFRSRPAPC